ncbi:MAG TPA: aminomethyl-transferring glycine dehydrogenase, partial [Acidimicrobiia bacterium]
MTDGLRASFVDRHIGPDSDEQGRMLDALGFATLDELTNRAVPSGIRSAGGLELAARSEPEALDALHALAERNEVFTSLIGMGYSGTVTPTVILRNVLENPAWYTAYTPYQPEISQGRLEALLNFQTMVADLTGMDLANASLLDEATAAAEAMAMCRRLAPKSGDVFFVDADAHPQTIEVVRGRAEPTGVEVVVGDPATDLPPNGVFGVLLQYPGSSGAVVDHTSVIETAHEQGALVAVMADLLALTLLRPPGEIGADLVAGSAQRFGVPMGYGGPHAAFLACRAAHQRTLPGRLVGVSVDASGRRAYRLALQTREQHIRREKATSNICTAQVLLAVIAGLYAAYHGPEGLRAIAQGVRERTSRLAASLAAGGFVIENTAWFDTITVSAPGRAEELAAAARERRINLRVVDADRLGIALDETTTDDVLRGVCDAFGVALVDAAVPDLPERVRRTSEFMTHPVFHEHRSETSMLRYLRRLADRDLALDRTMIPLGSCTMKLNATTEMIPITWPEFAQLHPFAPVAQATGYRRLFEELEQWLCGITGYDAVSLQPNAGSQGELAGLLAIRAYHRSIGQPDRDACLIPSSAHGTNAASAVMAGMRVVVVATDHDGNIDFDDLKQKASDHAEHLGALMATYPSTHGVFEPGITDVAAVVHEHGGQVYVDGANLNALVGLAQPGKFGADVSHLNLHKTFCIPHGGGGPGVGPVGVRAHLAPFLPGHSVVPESAPPGGGIKAISAAPWGSAGILPISWAYIAMMGSDGLRLASQVAILSANYVARRLGEHYPVLYAGSDGLVAHECILDLRPITAATGVTVEDVAKRLIDYGFHAPTMSFPVAGT